MGGGLFFFFREADHPLGNNPFNWAPLLLNAPLILIYVSRMKVFVYLPFNTGGFGWGSKKWNHLKPSFNLNLSLYLSIYLSICLYFYLSLKSKYLSKKFFNSKIEFKFDCINIMIIATAIYGIHTCVYSIGGCHINAMKTTF